MRMYTVFGDTRRVVYRTVTIMRMYTAYGDTRRAELQACAVIPFTKYFWKKGYTTKIGSTPTTAIAILMPMLGMVAEITAAEQAGGPENA